ncbi:Phosphoribosylglycinamide formyltransferase [subsurface metagenome]
MRVPAAILMSGTGSNARKLIEYHSPHLDMRVIISDNPESNYRKIASAYGLDSELNDIYRFHGLKAPGGGLTPAERKSLRDRERRKAYDLETDRILQAYGIKLIAAAGYDWIISPFLCRKYIIVNVHPGDLRVTDKKGKRKYVGLGWIPSAKAILNGERYVHSSTHLVNEHLDGGPIARVSCGVPINLPESISRDNILPPGVSLEEVVRDINEFSGRRFAGAIIYTHSKKLQEDLKRAGDWIEFPLTLHGIAGCMLQSRLVQTGEGSLQLDGKPVKDLFLA